jgi:hypothetical protein
MFNETSYNELGMTPEPYGGYQFPPGQSPYNRPDLDRPYVEPFRPLPMPTKQPPIEVDTASPTKQPTVEEKETTAEPGGGSL